MKRKLAEKVHGKSDVSVGKRGLTDEVINEIKRRLDAQKIIKVRVNRSIYEKEGLSLEDIAKKICERVGAEVIDMRGRTFVLSKRTGEELKS